MQVQKKQKEKPPVAREIILPRKPVQCIQLMRELNREILREAGHFLENSRHFHDSPGKQAFRIKLDQRAEAGEKAKEKIRKMRDRLIRRTESARDDKTRMLIREELNRFQQWEQSFVQLEAEIQHLLPQ